MGATFHEKRFVEENEFQPTFCGLSQVLRFITLSSSLQPSQQISLSEVFVRSIIFLLKESAFSGGRKLSEHLLWLLVDQV